MRLIALIPFFPLIGFLINGLLAKRFKFSEKLIGGIACTMVAFSFLCSVYAVYEFRHYRDTNQLQAHKEEERLIALASSSREENISVAPQHHEQRHANEPSITEHEKVDSHSNHEGKEHELVATPYKQVLFEWISGGGAQLSLGKHAYRKNADFSIEWAYQLDQLSGLYILFITFVAFFIHLFAIGYMHGEEGFYRFFAYLNLFMFMMLTLVLGANFLMMFVGWEGVGLCSYLLIGYYFQKKEAGAASKKAFVVNRIGDFGLSLGVMGIFSVFGTLDYSQVMAMVKAYPIEQFGFSSLSLTTGVLTLITLALFVGATGKSAQIPLFIWLPDAMAGPTPVSALIHAATMVTAGVYMVARCNPLFLRAPTTMMVVAIVGCATAFVAATIGITQTDIKKVLAYSTVSQLGYMFLGCGVGAFVAGIFHVVTHAFFKAQLFLGSGSVIHGGSPSGHQQEMAYYGNFRKYMPITFKTMMISLFAICGIFPFAGFFSKDEILAKTLHTHLWNGSSAGIVLYIIGLLTAGITAFYMTRLMCLTFFGKERWAEGPDFIGAGHHDEDAHVHSNDSHDMHHSNSNDHNTDHSHSLHNPKDFHPHESPFVMWLPLAVLAVFALFVGFGGVAEELTGGAIPNFVHHWLAPVIDNPAGHLEPAITHVEPMEWVLSGISVAWAFIMMYAAYYFYVVNPTFPSKIAAAIKPFYKLSFNKWYWDELLDVHFVNLMKKFNDKLWGVDAQVVDGGVNGTASLTRGTSIISSWIDRWIVDALVNGVAWITRGSSVIFRTVQTGLVQNYMLVMILGIFILMIVIEWSSLQNFWHGGMQPN